MRASISLNRSRSPRRPHSKARAATNIFYHHDLGDALYGRWLDETMTYSSAPFKRQNLPLAEAQRDNTAASPRASTLSTLNTFGKSRSVGHAPLAATAYYERTFNLDPPDGADQTTGSCHSLMTKRRVRRTRNHIKCCATIGFSGAATFVHPQQVEALSGYRDIEIVIGRYEAMHVEKSANGSLRVSSALNIDATEPVQRRSSTSFTTTRITVALPSNRCILALERWASRFEPINQISNIQLSRIQQLLPFIGTTPVEQMTANPILLSKEPVVTEVALPFLFPAFATSARSSGLNYRRIFPLP